MDSSTVTFLVALAAVFVSHHNVRGQQTCSSGPLDVMFVLTSDNLFTKDVFDKEKQVIHTFELHYFYLVDLKTMLKSRIIWCGGGGGSIFVTIN